MEPKTQHTNEEAEREKLTEKLFLGVGPPRIEDSSLGFFFFFAEMLTAWAANCANEFL